MARFVSFLKVFPVFGLGMICGLGLVYLALTIIRDFEPFGYRLNYSLGKVERSRYVDKIDKFSFIFSKAYEIDAATSSAQRFGRDYLVGFREASDPRIGCEVRKKEFKLDLSLAEETIQGQLSEQFGRGVKNFKVSTAKAVVLDRGLSGFQFNFSFLDPLEALVAINQVLIPKGDQTYILICGAGKAYFDNFAPDFAVFFNSFRFEEK